MKINPSTIKSTTKNIVKAVNNSKAKVFLTRKVSIHPVGTMENICLRQLSDLINAGKNECMTWYKKMGYDLTNLSEDTIKEMYEGWQRYNNKFNKTMTEFKCLPKNIFRHKYYRGLFDSPTKEYIQVFQKAKVGDIIMPDSGFAFASLCKKEIEGFSGAGRSDDFAKVITEVIAPSGTQVSKRYSHLKEVMFPANAHYKVLAKEVKDGVTHLKLKYILPGK